jgi:hypothetical protein
MSEVSQEWVWRKIIEKHIDAYLNGGKDEELLHLAIMCPTYGLDRDLIQDIWAAARKERSRRLAKQGVA